MVLRSSRIAFAAATVLGLAACAERTPEPVVTAIPPAIEQPPPKPRRIVRARHVDPPCVSARIDLPQERKEALFRQFDAELGPVTTPAPIPAPDCQASR